MILFVCHGGIINPKPYISIIHCTNLFLSSTPSWQLHGFSSARKMSSAIVKHGDKYRLYNKGAAEWVLKRCTHVLDGQGHVSPMSSEVSDELASTVTEMAKRGLRCICLTYTDYDASDASRSVRQKSINSLLLFH